MDMLIAVVWSVLAGLAGAALADAVRHRQPEARRTWGIAGWAEHRVLRCPAPGALARALWLAGMLH